MIVRFLLVTLLLTLAAAAANAQRPSRVPSIDNQDKPDTPNIGNPMDEMRARLAVRYAEKERKENIDRASELARIGAEVKTSFLNSPILNKEDQKKVEKIEKLAKKIRDDAGGSDGDLSPLAPGNLGDAIEKIAELTDQLNQTVAATPKLVVSAGVIDQTNQIIQLVKYVRGINR